MNAIDTLTKGELIELLEDYSDDTPLAFMANFGDRANTMQALGLSGVEMVDITDSSYSDTGYKVVEHGEGDEEVLLLNYDSTLLD